MFRRILTGVGVALMTLTVSAGTASAQHNGHAGGHAVGHVGGGRVVVAPHATYVRPATHYYGARYGGAYRSSYGYHYPYYRHGVGYAYPFFYGSYGYGYPYYYGNAYADYGVSYPPDYSAPYVIAPQQSTSAYPPIASAPAPMAEGSARLTVQLPAAAKLWIDGQPTQQTGSIRLIETPPTLEPGRNYSYKLRAEWVQGGQTVVRERQVSFQAGNEIIVNLTIS